MSEGKDEKDLEYISAYAGSLCVGSVICAVLELIVSGTRLQKTVRLVIGAFLLCIVIGPLLSSGVGNIGDSIIEIPEQSDFSGAILQSEKTILKKELSGLIVSTLKSEGITPREVNVTMDIDEDNSISLIRAKIILSRDDTFKCSTVRSVMREKLGIESEVRAER